MEVGHVQEEVPILYRPHHGCRNYSSARLFNKKKSPPRLIRALEISTRKTIQGVKRDISQSRMLGTEYDRDLSKSII